MQNGNPCAIPSCKMIYSHFCARRYDFMNKGKAIDVLIMSVNSNLEFSCEETTLLFIKSTVSNRALWLDQGLIFIRESPKSLILILRHFTSNY